jgi:hypothetical protein
MASSEDIASGAPASSGAARGLLQALPVYCLSNIAMMLGKGPSLAALACTCRKAARAVCVMPLLTLSVVPDESEPSSRPPDAVTHEEALLRIEAAGSGPKMVELSGHVTERLVDQVLRHSSRVHRLSLQSDTVCNLLKCEAPSHPSGLSSLVIRATAQVYGIDSLLARVASLDSLSFVNCPDLNDSDIETISPHFGGLRHLEFRNCKSVTDLSLLQLGRTMMPALVSFCVAGCVNITDHGLKTMVLGHPSLQSLDCCNAPRIGDQFCRETVPVLKDLIALRLPPRLTDMGVKAILTDLATSESPPFGNLQVLSFAMTGVSDRAVVDFAAAAPKLHSLDLQGCLALSFRIVDDIPKCAPVLEQLDLRGNRRLRADDFVKLIRALPTLRLIVMDEAHVKDAALRRVASASSVMIRAGPGLTN